MRTRVFLLLLSAAGLGLAQSPVFPANGVVNAASDTSPIAPGSLFTIFGTGLASTVGKADSVPLSTALAGVTVEFIQNGTQLPNAPMLFTQPDVPAQGISSQINAQVPWEVDPSQPVQIQVSVNGVVSQSVTIQVGSVGPGVYASNGNAIAVNTDGTLAWAPGTVPSLTTHGAKAGDVLVVYASGLGPVGPTTPADGANSVDQLRRTTAMPIVTIGGVQAVVQFSGLSPQFVGVNQLNIKVPQGVTPGNAVPLQIEMGGITTANNTVIAITQ